MTSHKFSIFLTSNKLEDLFSLEEYFLIMDFINVNNVSPIPFILLWAFYTLFKLYETGLKPYNIYVSIIFIIISQTLSK